MRDDMPLVPVQRGIGALEADPLGPDELPVETPVQKIRRLLRGKFWWALLLGILLGAGGGSAGYFLNKPTWEGSEIVEVKPAMPRILYSTEQTSIMPMFEAYIGAQAAKLRSERVLNAALDREQWKATGRGNSPETQQKFRKALTVTAGGQTLRVAFEDPDADAAARGVRAVVEAFSTLFNEEENNQGRARIVRTLESERDRTADTAKSKRRLIDDLANRYGSDDLEPLHALKQSELSKIESTLWEMEATLALQELLDPPTTAPATTAPAGGTGPATAPALAAGTTPEQIALVDPQMRQYLSSQRDLVSAIKMARLQYDEEHINVKRLRQQLASLENEISAYRDSYLKVWGPVKVGPSDRAKLPEAQLVALQKRVPRVKEDLARKSEELKTIGNDNLRLKAARLEENQANTYLAELKQRLSALDMDANTFTTGRINVYEGPTEMIRDRRISLGILGGLGGLLLGFVVMMAVSAADNTWRSSQDARNRLGRTMMLGILPNLPDNLAEPEQAAIASHAVHHIRSLLQIRGDGDSHQVLGITSPASGSGKTSLALALGVSFASATSRTLLIDCDLRGGGLTARVNAIVRRKIGQILQREGLVTQQQLAEALDLAQRSHRPLGEMLVELGYLQEKDVADALELQQQKQVGLLDALAGDDLAACVAETGIENLSILPLGAATVRQSSRLSPASIRQLVEAARGSFDMVLFDAGPVPGSLEASQVAAEVDGVVLVMARGEDRLMAEHCMETLSNVGAKVAGVVFNRADEQDVAVYGTTLRSAGLSIPAGASGSSRLGPMAHAVASGESR